MLTHQARCFLLYRHKRMHKYIYIWIRNNDNGQRTKQDTLRELLLNEVNQEQAFVTRLGTCIIYFSQSMFMPVKV